MDAYLQGIIYTFGFDNHYQADRTLKKHYETTFGIFDHRTVSTKGRRPLSGMAALPGNTIGADYITEHLIDSYDKNGIYDVLKMSFREYCLLTPYEMKRINKKCLSIKTRKEREESNTNNAQLAEFNKIAGGKPPKNNNTTIPG